MSAFPRLAAHGAFVAPQHLYTRDEILSRPSPVPAIAGVYGWWFRTIPPGVEPTNCVARSGATLLYVGISPRNPVSRSGAPSKQNLRKRLRTHCRGNAAGSTLRKTLGCLLADELGLTLRPVGSRGRMTFGEGEEVLSEWMGKHALVSWVTHSTPRDLEIALIDKLDLPLNLEGNTRHAFHPHLTAVRRHAVRAARAAIDIPKEGEARSRRGTE